MTKIYPTCSFDLQEPALRDISRIIRNAVHLVDANGEYLEGHCNARHTFLEDVIEITISDGVIDDQLAIKVEGLAVFNASIASPIDFHLHLYASGSWVEAIEVEASEMPIPLNHWTFGRSFDDQDLWNDFEEQSEF